MSDVIKLVQQDTLPSVTITLKDEVTGAAFDLTSATISLPFRAVNSATVLFTATGTIVDAPNGIFKFDFSPNKLNGVAAGQYEAEIKVTTPAGVQTVFDPLKFRLRAKF